MKIYKQDILMYKCAKRNLGTEATACAHSAHTIRYDEQSYTF